MTWLSIFLALIAEITIPNRWLKGGRALGNWMYKQCEINLGRLGLPNWRHVEWLVPVGLMAALTQLVYTQMSGMFAWMGALVGFLLLLHVIEFRRVLEKLTLVQLLLNQGDADRAEATLEKWQADYEGKFHHHTGRSVVIQLLAHASERSMRQLFVPIFWLWAAGPTVLVTYCAVWYAVRQQRLEHLALSEASTRLTLAHDLQADWPSTIVTPRFLLYLMEWLPARLLMLMVALVQASIDVLQAIQDAGVHTPWSNRAQVVAAWLHACDVTDDPQATEVASLVRFRLLLAKVLVVAMACMWLVDLVLLFSF